jgi:hypothetical protein
MWLFFGFKGDKFFTAGMLYNVIIKAGLFLPNNPIGFPAAGSAV